LKKQLTNFNGTVQSPEMKAFIDNLIDKVDDTLTVTKLLPAEKTVRKDKTLVENLVYASTDTGTKQFDLTKYAPLLSDPAELAKIIDPLALTQALTERNLKRNFARITTEPQQALRFTLQRYLDNEKQNIKSGNPQLNEATVNMLEGLVKSIDSVAKQIRDVAPDIDTQIDKFLGRKKQGDIIEKILSKVSASQIGANISTALAQGATNTILYCTIWFHLTLWVVLLKAYVNYLEDIKLQEKV
jgi:hypothetical protein